MASAEFKEGNLAKYLNPAFEKGGVMEVVAQSALELHMDLTPDEVAEVIVPRPPRGEPLAPRFELVNNAKDQIKEAANQNADEIYRLASQLGQRHEESISDIDIVRIHPEAAIWTIEGGANRTSVVRRQLAIDAMQWLYGEGIVSRQLFQIGSNREIPFEKNGKPNPEHPIVKGIAPDFLPDKDCFTEFEVIAP